MIPTPEMVRSAGAALFGDFWRRPFEAQFGIGHRKLQRVLKDQEDMGAEMWGRVQAELRVRHQVIGKMLEAA